MFQSLIVFQSWFCEIAAKNIIYDSIYFASHFIPQLYQRRLPFSRLIFLLFFFTRHIRIFIKLFWRFEFQFLNFHISSKQLLSLTVTSWNSHLQQIHFFSFKLVFLQYTIVVNSLIFIHAQTTKYQHHKAFICTYETKHYFTIFI